MERKDFIKKTLFASVIGAFIPQLLTAKNSEPAKSTYDSLLSK